MNKWPLVILGIAGLATGALIGKMQRDADAPSTPPMPVVKAGEALEHLPALDLPLLDGSIAPESEWQDKIRVVNFWATWCPPCRKEMPVFIKLQNQFASQNVQFLGIAIDDRAAVQDFVDQYGINFPTLIGDERALNLSRDLGNRYGGLPFTAIVDQSGKVVIRHTGELSEDRLRVALEELVSTGKTRS